MGFALRLGLYSLTIQFVIGLILWMTVVFGPDEGSSPLTAYRALEEPPTQAHEPVRPSPANRPSGSPPPLAMEAATPSAKPDLPPLASPVPLNPVVDSLIWDPLVGSAFGSGGGLGEGVGAGFGNGRGGRPLGGVGVKAKRLGVILDVSSSMNGSLPRLRRELARRFPAASTVSVPNCELHWTGEDQALALQAWMSPSLHKPGRQKAKFDTVISAVQHLVFTQDVDAIYWFSDFHDSRSPAGLDRLAILLGTHDEGPSRSTTRLYLRSVGKEPDAELESIVRRSGGEWR